MILDNCEHLVEEAARIADAILRAAPHVRIVATSREPLRIAAEHVYHVPSLTVPSGDALTSEEVARFGASALFVERARAADAKFALTDENAPIVGEICRRLDGIALAIELAAARLKVMTPQQLAQKLDERFRVLTGGSRTAMPRQQTMRALIEWSYDLLPEQEQRLLCRLAVFAGGWTLEAVQAVCIDGTLDALSADDLLSSLVEKSLVVYDVSEVTCVTGSWNRRALLRWRSLSKPGNVRRWNGVMHSGPPISPIVRDRRGGLHQHLCGSPSSRPSWKTRARRSGGRLRTTK